jgi:hypothetical protein
MKICEFFQIFIYDGGVVSPLASTHFTLGSLSYLAKKFEKIPRTLLNIIIRKLKISCWLHKSLSSYKFPNFWCYNQTQTVCALDAQTQTPNYSLEHEKTHTQTSMRIFGFGTYPNPNPDSRPRPRLRQCALALSEKMRRTHFMSRCASRLSPSVHPSRAAFGKWSGGRPTLLI